jgi:protein disulfide-isomerase
MDRRLPFMLLLGWLLLSAAWTAVAQGPDVDISAKRTFPITPMQAENQDIVIEVWSDFVCPFCYIGKRNLEQALAGFAHVERVQVVHRCYQLDPGAAPAPGADVYATLAVSKGISVEESRLLHAQVTERARASGLDFDFDRAVPVNTGRSHRWMVAARGTGRESALAEAIFRAYFTEGRDIGDVTELRALEEEAGWQGADLDALQARAEGEDPAALDRTVALDMEAAWRGQVRGVPHYRFSATGQTVRGAQPPQAFLEALNEAARAVEAGPR